MMQFDSPTSCKTRPGSPAEDAARDGAGGTSMLIAGATWDVLALLAAISLLVFKPGHALRSRAREATGNAAARA